MRDLLKLILVLFYQPQHTIGYIFRVSEAFHNIYQGKGQNLHKKSNDPQVNKVILSYVVQCCIKVYTESLIWSLRRDYAVYHSVIQLLKKKC